MTEAQTALSRRAVACKGWRWLPGMMRLRATPPSRRDYLWGEGRVPDGADTWAHEDWPVIPDVTDAATLGCLLALVREAWEPYGTFVSTHRYDGGEWSIRTLPIPMFATEAEALVAALEGAP